MAVFLRPILCQTQTAFKGEERQKAPKQAAILDTVLAGVSLMSQLADIHILAKQKDNYASAWCEMCW